MSFTWIPLYEDLATRLLGYENRQPELLAFLGELKAAGLPMVRLTIGHAGAQVKFCTPQFAFAGARTDTRTVNFPNENNR